MEWINLLCLMPFSVTALLGFTFGAYIKHLTYSLGYPRAEL